MMPAMPRGIFRERDGWGSQHSVQVRYEDGKQLGMSQADYEAKQYAPGFEYLPWKDDYEARLEGRTGRPRDPNQLAKSVVELATLDDEGLAALRRRKPDQRNDG
jgi:hypothetical protein